MLLRSLSTVLAQYHFYSDFLSLLLTKKIHFESVRMIAFAQHSLSVLTFVKLMIECVVHLLSRFLCQSFIKLSCGFNLFGGFGNGLLLKNYCSIAAPSWRRFLAHLTILHFAQKKHTCIRFILGPCQKRPWYFACIVTLQVPTSLIIPSRPFGYDQV